MQRLAALETASAVLAEHFNGMTADELESKIESKKERSCSVKAFAKLAEASPATVHRWVANGIIKAHKNALGKYRIMESELQKIL
ncbi:helix-turn-helix domain-containing protein [Lentisphaera marina]|uniref:helix-turn-helix domain-containing protein n=1 Tax=Lentisphaera marina TaxID=1111041 RepID=UPI00236723E6|nr:helix-turn-helix domain-containing protein [Lentisphaera marina]MDD7984721.1 helix-turn-helix domain-containing protein [Lentisphaera marina]